jgi:hypothetical protein
LDTARPLLQHFVNVTARSEHIGDIARRVQESAARSDIRPVQIGIDQNHSGAVVGQADGQIHAQRRDTHAAPAATDYQ